MSNEKLLEVRNTCPNCKKETSIDNCDVICDGYDFECTECGIELVVVEWNGNPNYLALEIFDTGEDEAQLWQKSSIPKIPGTWYVHIADMRIPMFAT